MQKDKGMLFNTCHTCMCKFNISCLELSAVATVSCLAFTGLLENVCPNGMDDKCLLGQVPTVDGGQAFHVNALSSVCLVVPICSPSIVAN